MNKTFNILAVGDAVGMASCEYLRKKLWQIREANSIDLTVVNGENSADGNGMLPQSVELLFDSGADVVTGGNHSFRRREIYSYLDEKSNVLRPANMPGDTPGNGYTIINVGGRDVLVINLLGTIYMEPSDDPFRCADRILAETRGKYDFAVVDIHAEATSEKAALARYLDGRVNAVFGTHTHVATADARILPHGTGFITDLGMTGPDDSILGVKCESIIKKFLSRMPVRFEQADGSISAGAAIFKLDRENGRCMEATGIGF